MEPIPSFSFSGENLLRFAWKKKTLLLIISVAVFILSAVVSLTITARFSSEVILFPATSSSVSEALVSNSQFATNDLLEFGEEEEVERMLQILNSDMVKQKLVEKFDLFSHYGIDPSSKYRYTNLYGKMKDNISFRKTEFNSIEIRVLDTDPQVAADMANTIAGLIDSTIHQMQKARAMEAYEIVKKEYNKLVGDIAVLEDSLAGMGKQGVSDHEVRAAYLNAEYRKAMAAGQAGRAAALGKELGELTALGQRFRNLLEFLTYENERLSRLRAKYLEARVNAEQKLPNTYIVSGAFPAEKKATPKRSLIVLVSTLSAFLLALLLLAMAEALKKSR